MARHAHHKRLVPGRGTETRFLPGDHADYPGIEIVGATGCVVETRATEMSWTWAPELRS